LSIDVVIRDLKSRLAPTLWGLFYCPFILDYPTS